MTKLELGLACCDYDRTRAIFDGRARIDGCEVLGTPIEPEESFHRAFKYQEFDVSELSLSSYTMMTSRGDCPYVAIPAFVSRLFRHSGIYIRTDRGIATPADLAGKTIGVPEYQITANVWIRGILQDEYGVKPSSVRWRQGGVEEAGRTERTPLRLPSDVNYAPIANDRTLSGMLEAGELDAVIGARAPSCFSRGAPNIARMFPDYRAAERAYFEKTKIFPIMHVIGIRRSLVERHSWLAVNVYKAFIEAKRLCMAELGQIGHLFSSLPWSVPELGVTRALMGEDFWSYGADANEHVLDTFLRYHFEQGLSARRVRVDELFADSTFELSKI
jgi:4,5-dihydroxyphthalate decarboxylase